MSDFFAIPFLCSPFYPILGKLGLIVEHWMVEGVEGPSLLGIVLVMFFYAIVLYFVSCLFSYFRPHLRSRRKLRLGITLLLIISIFIIFWLIFSIVI